jgi:hypothetical protein
MGRGGGELGIAQGLGTRGEGVGVVWSFGLESGVTTGPL